MSDASVLAPGGACDTETQEPARVPSGAEHCSFRQVSRSDLMSADQLLHDAANSTLAEHDEAGQLLPQSAQNHGDTRDLAPECLPSSSIGESRPATTVDALTMDAVQGVPAPPSCSTTATLEPAPTKSAHLKIRSDPSSDHPLAAMLLLLLARAPASTRLIQLELTLGPSGRCGPAARRTGAHLRRH